MNPDRRVLWPATGTLLEGLTVRLLAMLLIALAILGGAVSMLLLRAERVERQADLDAAVATLQAAIRAAEHDWAVRAEALRAQIEFTGLLDASADARNAGLTAFFTVSNGAGLFTHAALVSADGELIWQFPTRSHQALASPATGSPRWSYGEADETLYRTLVHGTLVGGRAARLWLFVPLDRGFLLANTPADTATRLRWKDRPPVTFEAGRAADHPWDAATDAPTGIARWPDDTDAPEIGIRRYVLPPPSIRHSLAVVAASGLFVALGSWILLANWLTAHARQLKTLRRVAHRFAAEKANASPVVLDLDRLSARSVTEVKQLAVAMRNMIGEVMKAEGALDESQEKLRAIFRLAPVGIALSNLGDGCLTEVNDEMGTMLGLPPSAIIGRRAIDLGVGFGPVHREEVLRQIRQSGRAELDDIILTLADGRSVHIELVSQQISLGNDAMLLSTLVDTTQHWASERALREQKEAYAGIFQSASDGMVVCDDEGTIQLSNPGADRMFGRPAGTLHGRPFADLILSADPVRLWDDLMRAATTAATEHPGSLQRLKGIDVDGHILELEGTIMQARIPGRVVFHLILRDVSERARADAKALNYQFELSALTRQLMAQEKNTTDSLAQTLHDRLGQTLSALRIVHDTATTFPASNPELAAQRHRQTSLLIDTAIGEVRSALVDLRPPMLEEEGLYAALEIKLANRAKAHPQFDILLDAAPPLRVQRWPPSVEYALYMIIREALNNALQHADASLVRIGLSGDRTSVHIEVADDGAGMLNTARALPGHLGMIGMRERARAIGADLTVGPADDGGVMVSVDWRATS